MDELYGPLIAEKLIDQQLAQNLWDAGFQSVDSLMELPAEAKELRELLQLDCPALRKIGVAFSLLAAIKKLRIGTTSPDSVTNWKRLSREDSSITHSEPSSITSEPVSRIDEDRLVPDVVTKRVERIESALKETVRSIDALRECKQIQKYPVLAEELRLDIYSSAVPSILECFKAMLEPVLQQFRSKTADIEAVNAVLDQFEEPLIAENKLQETTEFLKEACSFLQEFLLDVIEQEGIPIVDEPTTTTRTIALTLNMGNAQETNSELIKSFVDRSNPTTIIHWPRESKLRTQFSQVVTDFVSFYRMNKTNAGVRFVCILCSHSPTLSSSSLSTCTQAVFVQLIEPKRRLFLSLPLSVHPGNIVAEEISPSTMTLSWHIDSQHVSHVQEADEWQKELIEGYEIFAISEEDDGTEELVYRTKGDEDTCRLEDLHQDTNYRFAIKTVCAYDIQVERSEWSSSFRTKREDRRALRVKDRAANVPDHCTADVFHLSRKAVPLSSSGIQKFEIGANSPKDIGKKVLLVVGGTGTGKTTLINSMANYLYEVRPEDPFRFKLISEEDEMRECGTRDATKSQTKLVGAYVLNDTRLNYQLTVVDTPGFGDTEGGAEFDRQTVGYIKSWFSQRGATGISQIDGICIVVKSTDASINPHVRHELTAVVDLFGKHMRQNILIMLTFSDAAKPPALFALKNIGIPTEMAFKFNNSAVFERYVETGDGVSIDEYEEENASIRKVFWDMGMRSFHEFFKQLDKVPSGSLCMSLEVLKRREILEQQTLRLSERVKQELEEAKNISDTIGLLVKNKSTIDRNRDFVVKLTQYKAVKRPLDDSDKCTLTCLNCNFSCLKQCTLAEGLEVRWAVIMRRTREQPKGQLLSEPAASSVANAANQEPTGAQKDHATCTVCPAKCQWSAHATCDYVIEYEEVIVEEKVADMLKRYEIATEDCTESTTLMLAEQLAQAFVEKEEELRSIVAEIRERLNQLNEIDMTPERNTTDKNYLIMLVEGEKRDMLPGYRKRIAILERQLSFLERLDGKQTAQETSSPDGHSAAVLYLRHHYPQLYEVKPSNEQDMLAIKAKARLEARKKGDESDDENLDSREKLSPMKTQLKFWREMGF